jgi:hypothetical protein
MTMTGREADHELRRSANSLLRKNGNDLDKAFVAYCKYLLDGVTPTEIDLLGLREGDRSLSGTEGVRMPVRR